MNYIALGCLSIDNTINAQGVKRLRQFGGNAAYGAAGMHVWEPGKIGVVSRMGNDFPREWVTQMDAAGIDTSGIREAPLRHMMFSGMVYEANGDRRELVFNEDAESAEYGVGAVGGFPEMTPEMVEQAHENFAPEAGDIPGHFGEAGAVLICARHYDRQMAYADYFRRRNPNVLLVMDTGKDYMKPRSIEALPALFSKMDVIVPSEAEVRDLYGDRYDMETAAVELSRLGAKAVVIKVGSKGCITYDSRTGKLCHVPVYDAGVQDPTGAGDSFCGGFTVGLKETGDLIEAAMYGAVSASFIIEHFGVTPALSIPRAAAEERLAALRLKYAKE